MAAVEPKESMKNNALADGLAKLRGYFNKAKAEKTAAADTSMRIDAKGRHCPVSIITDVDLARDELVSAINARAMELSRQVEDFKVQVFADIDAFIAISNSEYNAKIGIPSENAKRKEWKGNLQLINYNATQKICLKISDRIAFNEKLNSAMEKLQGLIQAHSGDIDDIIKVVVNEAFQVDKVGYIDAKKVLDLRRYKIKNPVWESAMQDIELSIQVIGSKSYLQFWRRDKPEDKWESIPLDIARL